MSTHAPNIGPTVAVIVAAGRGTRASARGAGPKQYVRLGDRSVLAHALQAFLDHAGIDRVAVAIHADDAEEYGAAVAACAGHPKLLPPVIGGATRQQSVLAGLEACAALAPVNVLIHDAARPFVSTAVIDRVLAALALETAAIAALPLADTLKRADADGRSGETIARDGLWRAQTPQGFRFDAILVAHRKAAALQRFDFTDDAAVAEWQGIAVMLVAGSAANIKLTTPEDLAMANDKVAELSLAERSAAPPPLLDIRTGQGFDVHRFTEGDHVWLCGVRVPHTHAVEAHSDGDVGLHALTDALLGAIADGDIGLHFKNTDPRWRGAASDQFLADAVRRVTAAGGRITNVDVTVLCEAPKISPHRDAMRARMAAILGIDVSRVALKATTTEQLGFAGRREGLAAMAIATVVMPPSTSTSVAIPTQAIEARLKRIADEDNRS
jgi:2-C-methyl-D-erythritol 4-phosphate cytidylyltransferase / 2-C-methyl-D-erythritol 2,4-cyclodiphosphate synthase